MKGAKKQSQTKKWNDGSRVEVCSWEEGYGGAWFEAVVLSRTRNRSWKVMYENFVAEDGGPLVDVLPESQIRPLPPKKELPLTISVGDSVEANDRWCWWRGVVIKLHNGGSFSNSEALHLVYFPDTRTLKAYPRSELRLGQEWINGTWQCALRSSNAVSALEAMPANALEMDASLETIPGSASLDYQVFPCRDRRGGTPQRNPTRSQRNTSSADEASESPLREDTRPGKRRLRLEELEDPTPRKRREIQSTFLSENVRSLEVSAYRQVLEVFLKRGINSDRLDVLHKTANALNISPLEQLEFYRALKAPSVVP